MSKWETLECNVCGRLRPPRLVGGQWFEIYWTEMQEVVLHACGGCAGVMERLLVRLGFQVETPCLVGPDCKAMDRIVISGFYGAVDESQMHPALSKILKIPPCPDHGPQCLPWAEKWIESAKKLIEVAKEIEWIMEHGDSFEQCPSCGAQGYEHHKECSLMLALTPLVTGV